MVSSSGESTADDPPLLRLALELRLRIFSFCSDSSLLCISLTCKSLSRSLVESDAFWLRRLTWRVGMPVKGDCPVAKSYSGMQRYMIGKRWVKRACREEVVVQFRQSFHKCIPWIQCYNGALWLTMGPQIWRHRFLRDGRVERAPAMLLENPLPTRADFCRFSANAGCVAAGTRGGELVAWNIRTGEQFVREAAHESDVHSVSVVGDVLVSGSRDGTAKLWSFSDALASPHAIFPISDRVWSTALPSSAPSIVALGAAAVRNGSPPVSVWDLATARCLRSLGGELPRGAGTYHVLFGDGAENELLTCGFDTVVRRWDLRMGESVFAWSEPYDNAVFSLAASSNAIFAGTSRHGLAWQLDARSSKPIQSFYIDAASANGRGRTPRGNQSPVYSLAFNTRSLLVASNAKIIELVF